MDANKEEEDNQLQMHESEAEYEVMQLREQIAFLSEQFFQERRQWLEEKRRLQDSVKSSAAQPFMQADCLQGRPCSTQQRVDTDIPFCSEVCSEAAGEDGSQCGQSAREPISSFSWSRQSTRSASPNQAATSATGSPCTVVSANDTTAELMPLVADLQRQLEESRRSSESASVRWTLQREALQRQVHALINMSVGEASGRCSAVGVYGEGGNDQLTRGSLGSSSVAQAAEGEQERMQLAERISELEIIVEDLQAERDNLEEQLRMLAADATRSRRVTHGSVEFSAVLEAASTPPSLRSCPEAAKSITTATIATMTTIEAVAPGSFHTSTLHDSANMADLLADKAALERELRQWREEFVAVPRTDYAELSSLRSQLAFLKAEMDELREEAEEAAKLRVAAEAALSQAFSNCVEVPHDEYQRLRRLEAQDRAREASAALPAASPSPSSCTLPAIPVVPFPDPCHKLAVSVTTSAGLSEVQGQGQGNGEGRTGEGESAGEWEEQGKADAEVVVELEQERDTLADQVTALRRRLQLSEAGMEGATVSQLQAEVVEAAAVGIAADATAVAGDESADVGFATMQSEVAALRDQLSASVGASVVVSQSLMAQVVELQAEVEALRMRNKELLTETGAVRHALVSGQVQASDEARAAAAAAEVARAATAAELVVTQRRIAELEGELAVAWQAVDTALAEREQGVRELVATREAALLSNQALADCLSNRYGAGSAEAGPTANEMTESKKDMDTDIDVSETADLAEARIRIRALEEQLSETRRAAVASQAEWTALLQQADAVRLELMDCKAARKVAEAEAKEAMAASAEAVRKLADANRALNAVKLELEEARQLGALFQSRRDVLYPNSRRGLRAGLPQEWLFGPTVNVAANQSGGGASSGENSRGLGRRVSSVSEVVSEELEEQPMTGATTVAEVD